MKTFFSVNNQDNYGNYLRKKTNVWMSKIKSCFKNVLITWIHTLTVLNSSILIMYWRVETYKTTAVKADKLLYKSVLTRCVKLMNDIIVKRYIMTPNCPTIILETFSQLNSSLIALLYHITTSVAHLFYYKHIHHCSYYHVRLEIPNYLWNLLLGRIHILITKKILIYDIIFRTLNIINHIN